MNEEFAALETFLLPFKNLFAEDGINEIMVNKPGEAWVEKKGDIYSKQIPELDSEHLLSLGRLVAQSTEQMISEEKPLLSATLPNGYRIQIVFPPACEIGQIIYSIRKPSGMNLTLDEYAKMGAFDDTATESLVDEDAVILNNFLAEKKIKDLLDMQLFQRKIS